MPYDNYAQWKTEPITGDPFLSIVIPAYNEEVRIVPTIGAIASYVSDKCFEWELVIADDGSKDSTVQLVEDLGFVNLRVLKTPQNSGKGRAVQRGMLAAKGQYVLFCDADNSTPIEELDNFINALDKDGYHVAVGSRAAEGAEVANKSVLRSLLSNGLNATVRFLLQINVQDTQCGFKMYTKEAARRLHSVQTIMGFSFDLEVLFLAFKVNYRVLEIPVTWIDAPGSKVDTRREIQRFLRDILRIRMNNFKGIYKRRLKDYADSARLNIPTE